MQDNIAEDVSKALEPLEVEDVSWYAPALVEEENKQIIPGFCLATDMEFEDIVKLLADITSYTGAPSERCDNYLNQEIPCTGVIMHNALKRDTSLPAVNPLTGEVMPTRYIPIIRTVFKRADSNFTLAFTAKSVVEFVRTFLQPTVGLGDWPSPITLKFRKGPNNAYNIQVVSKR